MNKIVRSVIIFLLFRIYWRKLLPLGAIMTVTFALLQTYRIPYQLTIWNLSLPGTTTSNYKPFDTLSLNQTTPLSHDKQPKLVQSAFGIPLLNSSHQVAQSVEVVQEKATVTRRRRARTDITTPNVSVAPPPPVLSPSAERRRRRYLRDIRRLSPSEALIYAKREIESVAVGTDDHDPDLYAPLFRNVSVFERSYELMELILKVYIYRDGKRPIFHTPPLRGIYSSEGWFMKFMEASRQFVTRDPEKAHLFYLPYSSKQLQRTLYVVNSHNIKPLSIFLRDYVNTLASKYPFWNRTHGSDHFLVACHDWGPYTLTEHEELTQNTIKALCNADTSEGIFKAEKDVSLPETMIRNPRRPLRNMGGRRVSQRPILAFFAGRMHGRVRPILVKYWAGKDEDMLISGPLSYKRSQALSYPAHMKSSKYCICPMGFEVNSPRIVEAFYHECVPVIIADNFSPPLSDVLDWSAFSVIVAENDIPKLKEILVAIPFRRYLTMQNNVKMLQKHFYWNPRPVKYDMFHMILHSIWLSRLKQIQASSS